MRLTALTLRNFKSIGNKPVRIDFKPITLFFGPNSSGKSTVLQALHYLGEILERYNLDPDRTTRGGSLDFGGFQNLVHKRDLKRAVQIRADLDLAEDVIPEYIERSHEAEDWFANLVAAGTFEEDEDSLIELAGVSGLIKSAWVVLDIRWDSVRNVPFVCRCEVGINGELFGVCTGLGPSTAAITELNFRHPVLRKPFIFNRDPAENSEPDVNLERFIRSRNEPAGWEQKPVQPLPYYAPMGALPFPKLIFPTLDLSLHGYSDVNAYNLRKVTRALSQGLIGPVEKLRDGLKNLLYLGPIREIPPRNHQVERSLVLSRWPSGLSAWDALHRGGQPFVDRVNEWLEGHLDSGYAVRLKQFKEMDVNGRLIRALRDGRILDDSLSILEDLDQLPTLSRVTLYDEVHGIELLPQDVGVGISQVLPVIVAALNQKTGIVAIEQPELHIHPAFQVSLGDLFISQLSNEKDGEIKTCKLCFLIETHSEHLVLRLLRRIRETHENELPPGSPSLVPEDLTVYYVEPAVDGVSIKNLRIDETGEFLDRWPKGFFEERAEELF